MAGITQYLAILNSVARSFLAGSYSNGNLAPAHTLVDQNGVPIATGNPFPVAVVSGGGSAVTQSGAWSVGISGALPAFASPPAVMLSGSATVTGTFWQATQPVSLSTLPALASGTNTIGTVNTGGTPGTDYSANKPALPNIGANFAASGPFASYILIATVPASATRNEVEVQNVSGAQIAVLLDDGTAATSAAPANASLFSLAAGSAAGAQGGAWSSTAFKGRVQVYAASSAAFVEVNGR